MLFPLNKPIDEVYDEVTRYPALLDEISEYEIQKLFSYTGELRDKQCWRIGGLIKTVPPHAYHKSVDQTKLFEYWDEREGFLVKKLDAFREHLKDKYNERFSDNGIPSQIKALIIQFSKVFSLDTDYSSQE